MIHSPDFPPVLALTDAALATELPRWRCSGLVGIDEVGRGPLAGPVCAAAVMLPAQFDPALTPDSKAVSESRRQALAAQIEGLARGFALGWASVAEIDELNILHATELAMRRALAGLRDALAVRAPELDASMLRVLVDGNRVPPIEDLCAGAAAVVKGDARVPEIGAASILAKVARDTLMCGYDDRYPGFGFARHKGYGTRAHREALRELGPCAIHRRSFAPVRAALS
ncbi:MAG: ribonuclease HII [Pseudomonadota bacterium]